MGRSYSALRGWFQGPPHTAFPSWSLPNFGYQDWRNYREPKLHWSPGHSRRAFSCEAPPKIPLSTHVFTILMWYMYTQFFFPFFFFSSSAAWWFIGVAILFGPPSPHSSPSLNWGLQGLCSGHVWAFSWGYLKMCRFLCAAFTCAKALLGKKMTNYPYKQQPIKI